MSTRSPSFLYADPVTGGRLYVGGRRYDASTLDAIGVTTVLAAVEPADFLAGRPDIRVLRCQFEDHADIRPDAATARCTTREVAAHVRDGGSAYVHCLGGHNRGPYLAGLVLRELGLSGEEVVTTLLDRHSREVLLNDGLARALLGRRIRPQERGRRR